MRIGDALQLATALVSATGATNIDVAVGDARSALARRTDHRDDYRVTIYLSRRGIALNGPFAISQAVSHQLAHILGGADDHGQRWRLHAARLGCIPSGKPQAKTPRPKFALVHPQCGRVVRRANKRTPSAAMYCLACGAGSIARLEWTRV